MIALDNELKNIMVKLLEGYTRLESKVTSIDDKVTGLETEVRKHSIKIETIGKHINIIVEEVQTWVVLPIPSKRYVSQMEYHFKVFILTFLE